MSKLIFPSAGSSHLYYFDDQDGGTGLSQYPTSWEPNFTWKGREDYLEWVANWKICLKEMIASIRHQKAIRRDKTQTIEARDAANIERQYLRHVCANLLLIRKIGKSRSKRQRDLRRAA